MAAFGEQLRHLFVVAGFGHEILILAVTPYDIRRGRLETVQGEQTLDKLCLPRTRRSGDHAGERMFQSPFHMLE